MSNEQPETVDINTKEELNGQHIVIGMIIRQALCFMAMMSACHQIQYDIETNDDNPYKSTIGAAE